MVRQCSRCGSELRGHAFVTVSGQGVEHGRCEPGKWSKQRVPVVGPTPEESNVPNEPSPETTARLEALSELAKAGVLTDTELETARSRLLAA